MKAISQSPIGQVIKALRIQRGLSLNQAARLADVSAPNLSRTERGMPGGVHARHLERIANVLGTSVVTLHSLAEAVADSPELLERPEELYVLTEEAVSIQRAYIRARADKRLKVKRILGV